MKEDLSNVQYLVERVCRFLWVFPVSLGYFSLIGINSPACTRPVDVVR